MLKKKAFLAGILITTLLVGCTGNANSTSSSETSAKSTGEFSGVKLVYWSNWEATEPQGVVITAAVEEFKKETGAEVDLQFKGRKGIKEGLIPALDAEQQVDLFDGQNNKSNYGDRIISLEDLVKENLK